jgi:hypothetical protein
MQRVFSNAERYKNPKNTSDLAAIIVTGYDDLSAAGGDLTMP